MLLNFSLIIPAFLMVFFKAMQQQNVIHRNYLAIPFATYGIACCDAFLIVGVVDAGAGWPTVNGLAFGGALGCLSAMFLHRRLYGVRKQDVK